MSIHNKAMLCQLSISRWSGQKIDKGVTSEIEQIKSAHDSGKFTKTLVSKALLEPINQHLNALAKYHTQITLPWTDKGPRLLSSTTFMDYNKNVRDAKTKMQVLLDNLVKQYPTEVQAARNRLGAMYNPDDYPDPSDLRSQYAIDVEIMPVPDQKDFRVDMADDELDEVKQNITAKINEKQQAAVESTYARIREVTSKVVERLSDDKAIFKDTLMTNVSDLVNILDGLNITNDPEITNIGVYLRNEIIHPPEALRRNLALRRRTAEKAQELLTKLP